MHTGRTARGFNFTAICPQLDYTAEGPKKGFSGCRICPSTVYLKVAIRDFMAKWGRFGIESTVNPLLSPPALLFTSSPFEGALNRDEGLICEKGFGGGRDFIEKRRWYPFSIKN